MIDLCRLRRDFATKTHQNSSFFKLQSRRNLIRIPGGLKNKIGMLQQELAQSAKSDYEIIKKITGVTDIRYFDMAFLKEKMKAVLLAGEKNNIQMLTSFSITNVLNGLLYLLKNQFSEQFSTSTIVLDQETGELITLVNGIQGIPFAMNLVDDPGYSKSVILF